MTRHIEWLLSEHDCVILPGFGAFVAGYERADVSNGQFTAPQRIISFNPAIKNDDGLLTNLVSQVEQISYGNASRRVANAVNELQTALHINDNQVKFGHIGTLVMRNGKVEFAAGHGLEGDCFGLQSFTFPTLAERKRQLMESLREEIAEPEKPTLFHLSKKALRTAASIALIIGLGFLLSTPLIIDRNSRADEASLMMTQIKKVSLQVIESIPEEPQQTVMPNADVEGKYILVICTMQSQKGAEEYCAHHNDIKTHISHRGKHYRIYVASSDSKAELYNIRKQLPKKYKKSWVGI